MSVTMHPLLKTLVDQSGTDLHITTNSPPQIRIDGKMVPLQLPPMTAAETKQIVYSVLTDTQKKRFEETLEVDFSFGGWRASAPTCSSAWRRRRYRTIRGRCAISGPVFRMWSRLPARLDPRHRPGLRQDDDPRRHARQDQFRAALWHHHRRSIEYSLAQRSSTSASCTPTHSFGNTAGPASVRYRAHRRNARSGRSNRRSASPDGPPHLATLHTNSAAQTINRIIDVFPAHQQSQIRAQLSPVLEGIRASRCSAAREAGAGAESWSRIPRSGT
jgi:twitching motility protein PilT